MSSSKRSILKTGCSDGSLGSGLARECHRGRKKAGIETILLDTLCDSSIGACVARVRELTSSDLKTGALDALLNTAGGGCSMPVTDIDIPHRALSLRSLISVTQAFLPHLMNSTHPDGGAFARPVRRRIQRLESRGVQFHETLRRKLESFGIWVVNLVTGAVQSAFHDKAPHPTLPASSLYNVAKETVERAMTNPDSESDTDANVWASQVVRDLSRRRPACWVWRGKWAMMAWVAGFLPVGTFDGTMKRWCPVNTVLENIVRLSR
ncbi:uncharacterized protein BP01DRAFT_378041 [Aspergillus saccharolyticus JOP 1030-1]|uniref:NAD(P)-binding protein n=1 Tax=Aspergillus saccharolyticus JOP 1030-1 TaxID=1450539 RepID=A0A318ZXP2_9EURO|nr:hypothetical protein BP01DRAFT_378041 [Aspergillus saccharolyticus JOP 1030-1]PYH40182.1 hypothetical protein BP01DRAFT_378041 [Aspergillus saccharolyticus JOP 1030-1]